MYLSGERSDQTTNAYNEAASRDPNDMLTGHTAPMYTWPDFPNVD